MANTPIFRPAPCLMFVGCDAALAEACAVALPALTQLRVSHAAAAVERMLVTRPLAIVVDRALSKTHLERITECARDIRAEVVLAPAGAGGELVAEVEAAVRTAEQNRGERATPVV
jgi:hypothetical protein